MQRHVPRVLLIERVMREYQRLAPRPGSPQRRVSQQEGVVAVDDVRPVVVEEFGDQPGLGDGYREIAAVELLQRGRPEHVLARFHRAFELWGDYVHVVATPTEFLLV